MEISNPAELNTRPRSAYHCYTRFCKIMDLLPKSEQSFPLYLLKTTNKELYKNFIERVLDMNPDDLPQYVNDDCLATHSKGVNQKWREADELTQSVFKEIARKRQEKYKESLFDSYRSFARNCSVSSNSESIKHSTLQDQFQSANVTTGSTFYKDNSSICDNNLSSGITNRDTDKTTLTKNEIAYKSLEGNFTVSLDSDSVKLPAYQDPFQSTTRTVDSTFFTDEKSLYTEDMSPEEVMNMDIVPPTPKSRWYQVAEVDMPDDQIMMMAITEWDIGQQVLSFLQNTYRTSNGLYLCPLISDAASLRSALLSAPSSNIHEHTINGLLSGVDWS